MPEDIEKISTLVADKVTAAVGDRVLLLEKRQKVIAGILFGAAAYGGPTRDDAVALRELLATFPDTL